MTDIVEISFEFKRSHEIMIMHIGTQLAREAVARHFWDVMTAYTSTTLAEAQVDFVTRRQMRGIR